MEELPDEPSYYGNTMNKEITSKGWIWFIRAWATIPFIYWIPHIIAFFYPDRPSEAHFMFWLLVLVLEAIFMFGILRSILKRRIIWPNLRNLVAPMLLILPLTPTLLHHNYLSAADNLYNRIEGLCLILTFLPLMFFAQDPKKTLTPLPLPLSPQ